jgi:xanthine dehydrogenase accessory factor
VTRGGSEARGCVVIKGAGDLATGVAWRLAKAGFPVVLLEREQPLAVRRAVSFAEAVPLGRHTVEGVTAVRVGGPSEVAAVLGRGEIPVLVDPAGGSLPSLQPAVLVDGTMAKRNGGTSLTDAPLVIALGPGFAAGVDCHAVIETNRGPDLGRAIYGGAASPNTGTPGEVMGVADDRVVRAPASGLFSQIAEIGERCEAVRILGVIHPGGWPVIARCGGVIRGLIRHGVPVEKGMKLGDIDPAGRTELCWRISDKALAVAGGVLEAILRLAPNTEYRKSGGRTG